MKRLGLAILAFAACGDPATKLIEARRGKSAPHLAAVKKLAPIAAAQAPITDDTLKVPPGLDFKEGQANLNPAYNATIVHAVVLADPCGASPPKDITMWDEHAFESASCLLDKGTLNRRGAKPEGRTLTREFDVFDQTKYVLVIRLRTVEMPSPTEDLALGAFRGGRITGDALLYEIDTGAYLGGFPIDAKPPTSVTVKGHGTQWDQIDDAMNGRLSLAVTQRLSTAGASTP